MNEIICGDSLEVLRALSDESVDCVITSPPYFGLRDYGTAKWEGGESDCDHKGKPFATKANINKNCSGGNDVKNAEDREFFKKECGKCGAVRKDSQIGLEETPELYVQKLVDLFREVQRVLKKEGTVWLNLGDSYNGNKTGNTETGKNPTRVTSSFKKKASPLLKQKDIIGIPWRVAFALQADGWYLRQDLIWAKPNPMPESVTDRCTKSHEYIFLLSKSPKYYFDNEAIKEVAATNEDRPDGIVRNREYGYDSKENKLRGAHIAKEGQKMDGMSGIVPQHTILPTGFRNKRSVWTVTTKPFKEAHFATFPEALIEPMVLAGCPKEVCKKCGKARHPIMKSEYKKKEVEWHPEKYGDNDEGGARRGRMQPTGEVKNTSRNVGWTDCGCNVGFHPGVCLDPFMGAGTTAVVAKKLGRNYLGIELNPEYIKIAQRRIDGTGNPLL